MNSEEFKQEWLKYKFYLPEPMSDSRYGIYFYEDHINEDKSCECCYESFPLNCPFCEGKIHHQVFADNYSTWYVYWCDLCKREVDL